MITTLWNLFVSFGRATLLGFGGGPSIIPIYQNEVVNIFHWMDTEEFGNVLAFSNSIPGPIATKLSAYIGYKVAGWAGVVVSLTAVVIPTAVVMILLVGVMNKLRDNVIVKGMIRGVQPVIFVMFAMLAYDFAKYAFATIGNSIIHCIPFMIAAIYFIMVQYLEINPIWGIAGALLVGAIFIR